MAIHLSVLPAETLALLKPERGGIFVDGTLGMGGHSQLILEKAQASGAAIRLLGIDQDTEAITLAHGLLGENIEYAWGNFADISSILKERSIPKVDGILLDIGVSSYQLDTPERGFSFQTDGPLDMRMDGQGTVTAASILNTWQEYKLADLFFRYGEERLGRKIARFICEDRVKTPFKETKQLVDLIMRAYPPPARYKKPHPATRVFQALRIEVNQELTVLEQGIKGALSCLAPGGVLAIISFHSLEDRIVKQAFREAAAEGAFELLTKKPIIAHEEELAENPRSRSAKLRGIMKSAD